MSRADWFWYLLPNISLGVSALIAIGMYARAAKRGDEYMIKCWKAEGEADALRRFIGCKCKRREGTP